MKNRIKALLTLYHKGEANAITVDQIASILTIKNPGVTGLPIRKAVKDLIQIDRIPIGSCARGFYIIETEPERLRVIDNLVARVNGIQSRVRALRGCII